MKKSQVSKKMNTKTTSRKVAKVVAKVVAKPVARAVAKPVAKKVDQPVAKKKITFLFAAPPRSVVFVAGTFNSWSTDEHALAHFARNGVYQTTLQLAPGRYEYKFVVDGMWVQDPSCPDWVPNEHGSLNSVIVI